MTFSKHPAEAAVFTEEDVIRRALEPEQLGMNATPAAIRKWGEWIYPLVSVVSDGYEQKVEAIREELKSQKSGSREK